MKARLIREIGTRAWLRVYAYPDKHVCPASKNGCDSRAHLMDSQVLEDWSLGGDAEDHVGGAWPRACEACKKPIPEDVARRQVHRARLFDTPSGDPELGDMFWVAYEHWSTEVTAYGLAGGVTKPCLPTRCISRWSNCDGRHLHAILPNGHEWNVMGRATNCALPDDQEHRCWVISGEPPAITVGKGGKTCPAGAGSISAPGVDGRPHWHGFLTNGVFQG